MILVKTNRLELAKLEQKRSGFTIVELLSVVSIVLVLAGLLLPALQKTRARSQAISCLSNMKQLQVAWEFYASENEDRLVPNASAVGTHWVKSSSSLELSPSDLTNKLFLVDPRFAAFSRDIKKPEIYRCPSDSSVARVANNQFVERVRSYTLNANLGDDPEGQGSINRLSDISAPSRRFVFVDTHPGWSGVDYFAPPKASGVHTFNSVPASYHNGAANISFADGHVEIHRWRDARTANPPTVPLASLGLIFMPVTSPNNSDIVWLSERGLNSH